MLLCAAHGAPVVATLALRQRAAWPIDGGLTLRDGARLLGATKTWRGLFASLIATACVSTALAHGPALGLVFAALAMAGDLGTSFLKRRLRLASGTSLPILDQLPEALLPLSLLATRLGLEPGSAVAALCCFCVVDLLGTRLVARYKP